MRKNGTRQEWDRVRSIAANMFEQDREPAEIAKDLRVDDQTVRAWRRAYRKGGRDALVSRKPPGRPSRLNEAQRKTLAGLLLKTPRECGFDKYLWTQQLIADLIEREFQVKYHHDHIGVMLKDMGFSHQKPQRRAREHDPVKVAAWRSELWPELLKKVSSPAE
ncbi:winged helix-turn-helix domain-containing protein [Humisphaera borealis]|uniref:Winged helix-turn-helix domain-containing protein n=1 Tax=Humisphaera borealis TaxID=2807512 RepID=A0A7M2WXE6_9BACT|nr:winged helix-turn-helix domain-containing protein [Humisphaera borealis]QOV90197.1 winged helix-turn-helix domain-containing protein [Humisphaera borealis]